VEEGEWLKRKYGGLVKKENEKGRKRKLEGDGGEADEVDQKLYTVVYSQGENDLRHCGSVNTRNFCK
jgi:hypothetical protein